MIISTAGAPRPRRCVHHHQHRDATDPGHLVLTTASAVGPLRHRGVGRPWYLQRPVHHDRRGPGHVHRTSTCRIGPRHGPVSGPQAPVVTCEHPRLHLDGSRPGRAHGTGTSVEVTTAWGVEGSVATSTTPGAPPSHANARRHRAPESVNTSGLVPCGKCVVTANGAPTNGMLGLPTANTVSISTNSGPSACVPGRQREHRPTKPRHQSGLPVRVRSGYGASAPAWGRRAKAARRRKTGAGAYLGGGRQVSPQTAANAPDPPDRGRPGPLRASGAIRLHRRRPMPETCAIEAYAAEARGAPWASSYRTSADATFASMVPAGTELHLDLAEGRVSVRELLGYRGPQTNFTGSAAPGIIDINNSSEGAWSFPGLPALRPVPYRAVLIPPAGARTTGHQGRPMPCAHDRCLLGCGSRHHGPACGELPGPPDEPSSDTTP